MAASIERGFESPVKETDQLGAEPAVAALAPRPCEACGAVLGGPFREVFHRCGACGLWAAALAPGDGEAVVESRRAAALEPLRRANFEALLDAIAGVRTLEGCRVLDVGCGHGWFLEAAAHRGMRATGIEPDEGVAAVARARGVDVRSGFFPDALESGERYDVLTFNDVFEHLPDPHAALVASRQVLVPGGLLVMNLPDSAGFLFRLAHHAARFGFDGPWRRLWQVGFPSPHLYYFDARTLERCVGRHGYQRRHTSSLATLSWHGLWSRLTMDPSVPRWLAAAQWVVLSAAAPVLRFAVHPDILVQIYVVPDAERP